MFFNLTLLKYFCAGAVVLLPGIVGGQAVYGQDRAPRVLSQPVFKLSDEAIAAGIDGVLGISLTINKAGKVEDVVIHGGPAWPCGSPRPDDQIEAVRKAVKEQLMATTFEPPQKNGKPTDVELWLQFAIGEAYRARVQEENARGNVTNTKLVDAGLIEGRAIRLVKPANPGMNGIVVVRLQVDEQGNVAHAGVVTGHPRLQESVRAAACESKFSPTILHGKPVKVTGIVTYTIRRF